MLFMAGSVIWHIQANLCSRELLPCCQHTPHVEYALPTQQIGSVSTTRPPTQPRACPAAPHPLCLDLQPGNRVKNTGAAHRQDHHHRSTQPAAAAAAAAPLPPPPPPPPPPAAATTTAAQQPAAPPPPAAAAAHPRCVSAACGWAAYCRRQRCSRSCHCTAPTGW